MNYIFGGKNETYIQRERTKKLVIIFDDDDDDDDDDYMRC